MGAAAELSCVVSLVLRAMQPLAARERIRQDDARAGVPVFTGFASPQPTYTHWHWRRWAAGGHREARRERNESAAVMRVVPCSDHSAVGCVGGGAAECEFAVVCIIHVPSSLEPRTGLAAAYPGLVVSSAIVIIIIIISAVFQPCPPGPRTGSSAQLRGRRAAQRRGLCWCWCWCWAHLLVPGCCSPVAGQWPLLPRPRPRPQPRPIVPANLASR